ncbi:MULTISPECIES: ABC transporter substrate-binding protein [Paenibacillus]|uniref:ABC transporter substrate-binding protein n=1 Tax=Paenibacillus TaxID=44249 RepID=UPI000376FA64|nr:MULTISPECIES: sugar ABC transporter substrate-binding protein [Paenibacillus]
MKGMKTVNKKIKSFTILCLLVVLVASVLSSCGSDTGSKNEEKGKVTIKFWTIALQPTFNEYFNTLISEYQKSHPGVTIEWSDYPYDAISNKLLTGIASGNVPDVVNLNTEFANQMASKGALADLTPYLSDEEKGSYFEGIFNSTVLDGKPYALPWYTGTEVLYMNTRLVKQAGLDPENPPKTRDELNEWARQVKAKTGANGYALTFAARLFPVEGISILNEDKTAAAFNTPETLSMIQRMQQLIQEGVLVGEDANFDKQIQYYSSEQTAFEIAGPTFINFIKTAAPDVYENTVAVPLPTGKADVRLSNTMNLVVPAKSAAPEQAAEFAKFLTNAANQTAFAKAANTLPSTKESIKDPFFTQNDNKLESQAKVASAESLDKAVDYMVGVPNAGDVNSAIALQLQEIFLNGKDPQQGLDAAEQAVNQVLKQ